jgi:transcriptional regulator GlxA family with amidase domain
MTYPGCFVGDVIKLLETLCTLNDRPAKNAAYKIIYRSAIYSTVGGVVVSPFTPVFKLDTQIAVGPYPLSVDTLIIAHGPPLDSVTLFPSATLEWLRHTCSRSRRVVALGAGVFWLAAAGLIHRRHVSTHSALQTALGARYPTLKIESGVGLQRDGPFYTTSERFSAYEMALTLVEEDNTVGFREHRNEWLFPTLTDTPMTNAVLNNTLVGRACAWWLAHLSEDLNMKRSALTLCVSERSFRRQFALEVGCSPCHFLLLLRLEVARQALLDSDLPVDKIARRGGLRDGQQLARTFRKFLGVSPAQYRLNQRKGLFSTCCHPDYAIFFNAQQFPSWLKELLAVIRSTRPCVPSHKNLLCEL